MQIKFTWKVLLLQAFIALLVAIGVGMVQNHYNDPLRDCTQFKTFTEYKGYTCPGGKTLYVPPQE